MSDIVASLQAEMRERNERVRQIIIEAGREDILKEHDAAVWRLNSGVERARNVWHSISEAQRRVLRLTYFHALLRRDDVPSKYDLPDFPKIAGIKTLRNLKRRDLIAWLGDSRDPESKAVLTGHAHFVLKYGHAAHQANVPIEAGGETNSG